MHGGTTWDKSRAQNSVEQKRKSAARRFKAHYGRGSGKIRSAGCSPARKLERWPRVRASWKLGQLNSPASPAESKSKQREQEAKAGFGCLLAREPSVRVVNQALISPHSKAFCRHAGSTRQSVAAAHGEGVCASRNGVPTSTKLQMMAHALFTIRISHCRRETPNIIWHSSISSWCPWPWSRRRG